MQHIYATVLFIDSVSKNRAPHFSQHNFNWPNSGTVLIHSGSAMLHCSHRINAAVQRCVQPVAQYVKVNQQDGENPSIITKNNFGQAITMPKIGKYVFRELCRLIKEFNECVYVMRHQCPKHVTIALIDASYGYLCNEGYETFISSAECLMELDRQPTVKQCHEITLKHIAKANEQLGITSPTRFEKMCQALNYFSSCTEQPIAHGCGVAAWEIIFRVLRDTTNTLLPGCHFTGKLESFLLPPITPTNISLITTSAITMQELSQHEDKFIWSSKDFKSSGIDTGADIQKAGGRSKFAQYVNSRDDDLSNQGQRLAMEVGKHISIDDEDTDFNYYDSGNSQIIKTVSTTKNFIAKSAKRHPPIISFVHCLLFAWITYKLLCTS